MKIKEFLNEEINYEKLNEDFKMLEEMHKVFEYLDPITKELLDLQNDLDSATHLFFVARNALGIVNKLKDPEYKKKHARKVMTLLNQLRAKMQHAEKKLNAVMQPHNVTNKDITDLESYRDQNKLGM